MISLGCPCVSVSAILLVGTPLVNLVCNHHSGWYHSVSSSRARRLKQYITLTSVSSPFPL